MSISSKLRRAPVRLATGAFVLNSGLGKLKGDEGTAGFIHGMATGAYPFLGSMQPKTFLKALAISEVAIGSALLLPVVPAGLAGLALTGFAGGLVGLYIRTPSLHDANYRPTVEGTGIAKDIWMLAIGASLVIDAAMNESALTED